MDRSERQYRHALLVLEQLEKAGFESRLAGGCVRDRQLGVPPKDFDVATTALPEQVIKLFREKTKYKVVPTGIDHGTVTVVMPSGPVEITTLRADVETHGRHATVAFGTSFEADAERRDFTINAMFEDGAGKIYDYFGGQQDIKAKVLRFVGDANLRVQEDYLRILRLYRFWARLHFSPEGSARDAARANKAGLRQLSQERVTSEILLTLQNSAPGQIILAMVRDEIFPEIIPEWSFDPNETFAAIDGIKDQHGEVQAIHRLAALNLISLKSIQSKTQLGKLGQRLRLSNRDTKRLQAVVIGYIKLMQGIPKSIPDRLLWLDEIESMVAHPPEGEEPIKGILETWQAIQLHCERLRVKDLDDLQKVAQSHGHLRVNTLPITGQDVMEQLKIGPGIKVKEVLDRLRRTYYEEKWHTKEEGLKLLRITEKTS